MLTSNQEPTELSDQMPAPLFHVYLMHMLIAALVLVLSVVLFCCRPRLNEIVIFVPLLLIGLYLVIRALSLKNKWEHGAITEQVLVCLAVRKKYKQYSVLCTEPDKEEHLYEFSIPRTKHSDRFTTNSVVIFYVDASNPRCPVAWKVLSNPEE